MIPSLILLALAPAAAEPCQPGTAESEVDTGDHGVGPRFYVDWEPRIGIDPWVYQESNGMEGLQRNDERLDHTCGGLIASDTLLF